MKRQGGFTLIEMVVVIVILGILAVTAAPRFLDLQGDARESTLEGLKGALNGASGIVFGKAAIAGDEQHDGTGTIGGTDADSPVVVDSIATSFGYPIADATGIQLAVTLDLTNEWVAFYDATATPREAVFTLRGSNPPANEAAARTGACFVEYLEPTAAGNAPTVTVTATGC